MRSTARSLVGAALGALAGWSLAAPALAAEPAADLWAVAESDSGYFAAVNAVSVRRSGDIATLDMLQIYTRAQPDGADYRVGHHSLNCATRQVLIRGSEDFTLTGRRLASEARERQWQSVSPTSVAGSELAFVCDGDRDFDHLEVSTAGQAVVQLRVSSQHPDADQAIWNDYWLFAGGDDSYQLIDTNSIRRDGDQAWVKVLVVFRQTEDNGFDYVIAEDRLDCRARQVQPVAYAGFSVEGAFVRDYPLSDSAPQSIDANLGGRLEYGYVCEGLRSPGVQIGPFTAQAATTALRERWSELYRP